MSNTRDNEDAEGIQGPSDSAAAVSGEPSLGRGEWASTLTPSWLCAVSCSNLCSNVAMSSIVLECAKTCTMKRLDVCSVQPAAVGDNVSYVVQCSVVLGHYAEQCLDLCSLWY